MKTLIVKAVAPLWFCRLCLSVWLNVAFVLLGLALCFAVPHGSLLHLFLFARISGLMLSATGFYAIAWAQYATALCDNALDVRWLLAWNLGLTKEPYSIAPDRVNPYACPAQS